MEFFVENWLWFLVAAIIILMTLIGYIAEKTDFGRKDIPKKEKVKKEKKKPEANKQLTDVLETETMPEVQMSLATDSILEEPVQSKEELHNDDEIETLEDLNAPFGDITFDAPAINEEFTSEPAENLNDSFTDFAFTEPGIQAEPVNQVENSPVTLEDLSVPFGDVSFSTPVNEIEEVVEDAPAEELKVEDFSTPNIELPDLDTIVTEEDTDDVWKF